MNEEHYVIATGQRGRDRLKVLTRVFAETTNRLLDGIEIRPGMTCLDAGCGGGDVSRELARRVGPRGSVVGIDRDSASLAIAGGEARAEGIANIDYRAADIFDLSDRERFDVVYARFLLSHLPDPVAALARMAGALRDGGMLVVEDVEFSAHFSFPEIPAFGDYVRLYREAALARGGDPDIGPRLPSLLEEAGLGDVGLRVVQPAAIRGEVKRLSAITMELIRDAILSAGLASAGRVAEITEALGAAARDEHTLLSTPRVFQVWGRRSS